LEASSTAGPGADAGRSEHGLKRGAIGLLATLTIGVASVAPAYSLAAILGFMAFEVGEQLPAVLLVSFIPMLFVATAYYYLNRADPDCGTTFAWASRALGPTMGWLAGWAILTAGIIVIGLLANTAAYYTYDLIGWDEARDSKGGVILLSVAYIVAATYVTYRGIEISARTQYVLLTIQIVGLVLFAVVVLTKVIGDDAIASSVTPEAAWYSPFAIDDGVSALVAGMLLGVFAYWGWDSAVAVNEETEDATHNPGRAAVISTFVLLAIYVLVSSAALAWLGTERLAETEDEGVLALISGDAFASPLDKIVVIAVMLSALASTQTTVLPSSRTLLSMARHRATPGTFGRVHQRYLTPHIATWAVGMLAIVYYVFFSVFSETFYDESLGTLGLLICANYGINALACVVFFRRHIARGGPKLAVLIGVLPAIGFAIFAFLAIKSIRDFSIGGEDLTYYLGLQAPLTITIGLFILGVVLMLIWRSGAGKPFFSRRLQVADEGALDESAPPPPGSVVEPA